MGKRSAVIDFHSHILPKMDDGSKSVDMSLEMLRTDWEMGVDVVVATPHFYGFRESVSDFLARREHTWNRLSSALEEDGPDVLLGAEVAFYSGLLQLEELDALCLNGTKTLLLEMPFAPWTSYELNAVSTLCLDRGYQVVLAHLERFWGLQKDTRVLRSILQLPVWVQVNVGVLTSFTHRGRWVEMFREGQAHLLGSDCHNLTSRPPNLGVGRKVLERKAGPEVLKEIDTLGRRLLELDGQGG